MGQIPQRGVSNIKTFKTKNSNRDCPMWDHQNYCTYFYKILLIIIGQMNAGVLFIIKDNELRHL